MSETLDPGPLFDTLATQIPEALLPHMLVVGSLAAAYHFRDALAQRGVNTKDADLVIQPAGAVDECRRIAETLMTAGWRHHEKCFPQRESEPLADLRAIRLYPPEVDFYFVELLGMPEPEQLELKRWTPVQLADGWYGLPTFRYMGLLHHGAQQTARGLGYAAPAMMALANLLSHARVGEETMSEPIGGRTLRRAAKDLGRVIGLAYLTPPDELETWTTQWQSALRSQFPVEAEELARRVGDGLRELLDDGPALDEAAHALDIGLLAGRQITVEQLEATGARVLRFVVEPTAAVGR